MARKSANVDGNPVQAIVERKAHQRTKVRMVLEETVKTRVDGLGQHVLLGGQLGQNVHKHVAVIISSGGKMPGMLVPVTAGIAGGWAPQTAAISGSLNVAQALGPENMKSAPKRTAKEIAALLQEGLTRQGWIGR